LEKVLEISNVTKRYPRITAVSDFSLTINKGETYGILGPNGSGKTTILSVVTGIIFPNNGSYSWFGNGHNDFLRKKIGSLVEVPNFYPYLSLAKNLEIVSLIKEIPINDIDRVLKITGLIDRKNDKFYSLSLGLKQRLAIAATLLGDPEVLILDEPTNGLDPEGIAEVRNILIEEGNKGKTIILASHILDEVEKICSHVAILKEGKLLANGNVNNLLSADEVVILESENIESLNSVLKDKNLAKWTKIENNTIKAGLAEGLTSKELNKFLFENNIILSRLEPEKDKLESQFLELVKE
jgi:ABC-2 type transport system ATP-binding protein